MEKLESLPLEVQYQVKEYLKAYNSVNVIYEDGQYRVSTAYGIRASYPLDFKVIGAYQQEEIYTLKERIENYRNEFKAEPYALIQYAKQNGLEYQ